MSSRDSVDTTGSNLDGSTATPPERGIYNTRYPYTYACDYVREISGIPEVMSRSKASQLRSAIADAIGWDDEKLANALAEAYLKREKRLNEQ